MPPGLNEFTQADWSGGMCRAVARHLIPNDAAYDVRDGLLDDDGDVYQRGPTSRLTATQNGASLGALWELDTIAGRRTAGIGAGGLAFQNGAAWTTVAAGLGTTVGGGLAATLGGMAIIPYVAGGNTWLLAWGGQSGSGPLVTGGPVVTVTNGSTVVTRASGSWPAYVLPGMFLAGGIGAYGWAMVKSVDSATQLTLATPWEFATQAMSSYAFDCQAQVGSSQPIGDPRPYPIQPGTAAAVAVLGGRVLVATGRRVYLSGTVDQDTGGSRPFYFDPTDFHEFPADVVALAVLRDVVFVFTRSGVWSISNAALRIVDTYGNGQHRVQRVSGDVVLRSPGGLTPWRDSLIVCAVGGVYVMDASGAMELVSRSISPLWQSLMASGQQVYQAMAFRDHVFVPVGGQVLVGRLDRRTKTPVGSSAPWTRFSQGDAAAVAGLAVQDPFGSPKLVGGAPSVSGHLLDLTGVFGTGALPAAAGGMTDANGAPVGMVAETREYVLDAGGLATVRDVALEYESTDGQLVVSAAVGQRATPNASPTYALLASSAAGNYATQNPRVLGVRREARRISFQIASSGSVTGWRLRAVRTRARLRGRRR